MRPGEHGYEFKTKAPVSVCVYICRHLHGVTPYKPCSLGSLRYVFDYRQPEVAWTLMRILDWSGVRASR